jgi:hypothetical protein
MRPKPRSASSIDGRRSVPLLCALALAALAAGPSTGRAAEPGSPWQTGQYRDFAPAPAVPKDGGVRTRAIGPALKLEHTVVQRPRLSPGDPASLRAQYSVLAPSGSVEVRETRIIRFNGVALATLTKVVPRSSGPVGSEYQLQIPRDAAEGWYTVTTVIEPARTTRSADKEQGNATFYIDPGGAVSQGSAVESPKTEDGLAIKLWTDKPQYRVGETVRFHFETNRDAHVTLVNVGTSGATTILFPNRFSGGHGVKGKKTYSMPEADDHYELALSGPPGIEMVYALVTLKPVRFVETDFTKTRQIFRSVTDDASSFTRDINILTKRTPLKELAKAVLELEVVP